MMKPIATIVVALALATLASAAHASRSKTPLLAEFKAAQKRAPKIVRSPKSSRDNFRSFGARSTKRGFTETLTNNKVDHFRTSFLKPSKELIRTIEFTKHADGTLMRTENPGIQEVAGFVVSGSTSVIESPNGTRQPMVYVFVHPSDYSTAPLSFLLTPTSELQVSGPITPGMKQNRKALLKAVEPYGSVMLTAARRALAD